MLSCNFLILVVWNSDCILLISRSHWVRLSFLYSFVCFTCLYEWNYQASVAYCTSSSKIYICLGISQARSTPSEDPELSPQEKRFIMEGSVSKEPVTVIPWKLILSKPPVWALIVSHFCHNWGTFILLTWMPTYYNQVLQRIIFSMIHIWQFVFVVSYLCTYAFLSSEEISLFI